MPSRRYVIQGKVTGAPIGSQRHNQTTLRQHQTVPRPMPISPVIVVPGITASDLHDEYELPPEAVWTTMLKRRYDRVTLHPEDQRYELQRAGPGHAARPLPAHLRGAGRGAARRALRRPAGARSGVPLRLRLAPAAGLDRGAAGRLRARGHRQNAADEALPGRRDVSRQPDRVPDRPFDGRADHRGVRREALRRAHREPRGRQPTSSTRS